METVMTITRRSVLGIGVLVAVLAALPSTGCSYNKFVGQEEAIKAQWAQVENQLQRRNDLIPNLVETTKGFAQHEESVYKDIADARSQLLAAKSPDETIAAANRQTSALGRLLAVVENYPQLKATAQVNRLMDELSGTENRLAVARQRYNEAVQQYNTSRRQFPGNLTAKMFSFKDYPFFEAPADARQAPELNFTKQPSWGRRALARAAAVGTAAVEPSAVARACSPARRALLPDRLPSS